MSIKIKISKKPIDYDKAIRYLEKKVKSLHSKTLTALVCFLSSFFLINVLKSKYIEFSKYAILDANDFKTTDIDEYHLVKSTL